MNHVFSFTSLFRPFFRSEHLLMQTNDLTKGRNYFCETILKDFPFITLTQYKLNLISSKTLLFSLTSFCLLLFRKDPFYDLRT